MSPVLQLPEPPPPPPPQGNDGLVRTPLFNSQSLGILSQNKHSLTITSFSRYFSSSTTSSSISERTCPSLNHESVILRYIKLNRFSALRIVLSHHGIIFFSAIRSLPNISTLQQLVPKVRSRSLYKMILMRAMEKTANFNNILRHGLRRSRYTRSPGQGEPVSAGAAR